MFRFYLLFLLLFPPILLAGEWCPDGQAAYCEVYGMTGRWSSPSACAAAAKATLFKNHPYTQTSSICFFDDVNGQQFCFPMKCQVCPPGQVANPYSGYCQLPCPVDWSDNPPWGGVSVGLSVGTTCNGGCLIEWTGYSRTNDQGFTETYNAQNLPGEMCAVGSLTSPPLANPPPTCPTPSIIRSDGTCGPEDPQCPSWQHLSNHACVDTPCSDGKLLKCGNVDGTQICSCAGLTDCEPGTVKNAFGNCIAQPNCAGGQTMNPVTGVCEDAPADCPEGTHREGMICAKDPGDCQPGTWFIPGCGCVSDINSCANRNSDDMDGDGIPNNQDSDADGDGIPNSQDNDADNDGVPNAVDPTPRGLGTGSGDGQSADRDNDGTPDNQDDDIDGDGVPNNQDSDIDGDGVPNDQDSTPNNQDPSKTRDTSKSDPDGDLDQDGVPNSQDGDRDGDGIPNGDDATPDGRGDGTGVNDGQCDPATEQCGDGNDKPGKPAALDDRFYTKKEDRSFQTIWASFISRVQSARLVTAGTHFFSAPSGGGSCPTWQIPSTFFSPAIPITLQCSSEVLSALRIAGIIVTIVAAWLAFRIALL